MKSILKFIFISLCILYSTDSFSCKKKESPWTNPLQSMPTMSKAEAMKTIESFYDVTVEEIGVISKCGGDYFFHIKIDNLRIGRIPVPSSERDDGRYLMVRAQQFFKNSREILIARETSWNIFYDEKSLIADEFGMKIYTPRPGQNPLRVDYNEQVLYIQASVCGKDDDYGRKKLISKDLIVKATRFDPRFIYTVNDTYKKNDLRKAIINNDVHYNIIKATVFNNAKYCKDSKWKAIANRFKNETREDFLESPLVKILKKMPEYIKSNNVQGFLINNNKIIVETDKRVDVYFGLIQDLLLVERELKRNNIKFDRKAKLDSMGRWYMEEGKIPAPLTL